MILVLFVVVCLLFFLPEHNLLPKQLNAMDTYAEGNLKSGVLYAKFKIIIDE